MGVRLCFFVTMCVRVSCLTFTTPCLRWLDVHLCFCVTVCVHVCVCVCVVCTFVCGCVMSYFHYSQFEMVSEEEEGSPIRASSATACHHTVLKAINKAR